MTKIRSNLTLTLIVTLALCFVAADFSHATPVAIAGSTSIAPAAATHGTSTTHARIHDDSAATSSNAYAPTAHLAFQPAYDHILVEHDNQTTYHYDHSNTLRDNYTTTPQLLPRPPPANITTTIARFSLAPESVTEPIGDLRAAGRKDAHHVIQDAAVRDVPGYDTNAARGVQLQGPSTARGTPHYNATQVQRQAGGGTYGAERRMGYKAVRKGGMSPADARSAIEEADAYFRSLGVTKDTPLRVPGNRPGG